VDAAGRRGRRGVSGTPNVTERRTVDDLSEVLDSILKQISLRLTTPYYLTIGFVARYFVDDRDNLGKWPVTKTSDIQPR
jgi:hypothetical protein